MSRSARLARLVLWPLFVAASTAGFAFGFGRGELVTTLALVPIAQWLYLAAAEALWPADGRGPSWRDPEAGRDVFHAIVDAPRVVGLIQSARAERGRSRKA